MAKRQEFYREHMVNYNAAQMEAAFGTGDGKEWERSFFAGSFKLCS